VDFKLWGRYAKNKSSLVAEVTFPANSIPDLDHVKYDVVDGLIRLGVINNYELDVVSAWYHRYGYQYTH